MSATRRIESESTVAVSPESSDVVKRPRILMAALTGAVMLWLAQPPVGAWPLAWIAPAFWIWLAAQPSVWGRREYVRFWLAALLYWLLALHWIRLPHPLTPIGWPLLAGYMALYSVATVALVRTAYRRWGVPLWIAAPIAWTGMELVQARLFTGFLMGAVSHSQAGQGWLRSIAAWVGAYGVTFAVVLVAATFATVFRGWRTLPTKRGLLGVALALAAAVSFGSLARWSVGIETSTGSEPTVALIQGDTRATWDPDPQRSQRIMDRQVALSAEAFQRAKTDGMQLDLVIWPESMFRSYLFTFDGSLTPPDELSDQATAAIDSTNNWFDSLTTWMGDTPVLVGIDRYDWPTDAAGEQIPDPYNSVALADGSGKLLAYYDKTHLVPFGEYIPFASGMPALYYLTPMSSGLHAGDGPVAMRVPLRDGGELTLSPSICYETVVSRVIRHQVAELIDQGKRPDALVNVTNDAWFWGSSELDMHLACGVYRAVEMGTPLLIAANGGLSAVVDARGVVRDVSPRMEEHFIIAPVPPKSIDPTPYVVWGDWFAGGCLLACGVVVMLAIIDHWRDGARPRNKGC